MTGAPDHRPGLAGALGARGLAAAAVALAAAAALMLESVMANRPIWPLLALAILGSAWMEGWRPAAFALFLASLTGLLLPGASLRDPDYLVDAAGFALVSLAIIALKARMAHWRQAASAHAAQAEQKSREARETAEELGLLIDGATTYAIYMLDPQGRVTIWNKGAERIKGWTEEEVLGQSTAIFYPAEEVVTGKPYADLDRARAQGRVLEEGWRVRKDGSEFLADMTITALRDEHGTLRGFAKIVRDITDQKAAERAIEAREAHLNSILATVPDAMVVIDEEGTMLSFSRAAERMFGYAEPEVLGRNIAMLMPSPDREAHDGYIARFLATGEHRVMGRNRRVIGRRKDGSLVAHELAIGETAAGGRRLFTGFMRDLTQQDATDLRLKELQSELIHVSWVSAMGAMASTLAHELNQPITAVVNYVETASVLLEDATPQAIELVRGALEEAALQSLRAGHIVRRLRDFVARGEVHKQVEDLPALIHEACSLGLAGLRANGVTPVLLLDPAATPVLADRVQIEQVLVNLIRNAAEAMADSEERVLTIRTAIDSPGFVRVTVADTGAGLAHEIAGQLFQAFLSTKSEGMGLGLSICRTIVEAHGGRIWAESQKPGGTRFHFTLIHMATEGSDGG